ncbi:MAG: NADH-quinone oxidoreductase subunit N [Buchnera aphidicola (Eriosoma harunire)]
MFNIVKLTIALLPILIIISSILLLLISISWRRNHFLNFLISITGLSCSLMSLFFIPSKIPIDINFLIRLDGFAIFYSSLVLIFSLLTCILSHSGFINYKYDIDEFYVLLLLSTVGCLLLVSSVHMSSLFIGLELVSIPLFGLIGYVKYNKKALESTFKYLILSGISSSFLLFGIALVYICVGGLSFIEIQHILNINSSLHHITLLLCGLVMILVALFFKISLFPCHLWIPDVYEGMTSLVLTYFSTVVKIAMFIILVRLFLYLPINKIIFLNQICSWVAFFSILFGNIMALFQYNLKRLLAFSSISHMGYALLILISDNSYPYFLETIGLYLIAYSMSNFVVFSIMHFMSNSSDKRNSDLLDHYQGFFWKYPLLTLILTSMIFSLAGIPISLGFISKFLLLSAVTMSHFWFSIIAIILGSIISLYYYLRIIINFFYSLNLRESCNMMYDHVSRVDKSIVVFLGMMNIFFGFRPDFLINFIHYYQPFL